MEGLTYLEPLMSEPFEADGETFLKCIYYGNAMYPTLKGGDRLLFKKRFTLPLDSEIYMVQFGELDNVMTGRISRSKAKDCVYIFWDNPIEKGGVKGRDIERKHIIGIWELLSSQRIHKQI